MLFHKEVGMNKLIVERVVGSDLVLINGANQSLCVLDEVGRQVWEVWKQAGSWTATRAQIDAPPEEVTALETFGQNLQEFLEATADIQTRGMSMHRYFSARKIPLVVGLEINTNCQLFCRHCYNPQRDRQSGAEESRISVSMVEGLAADLAELGTPFVIITGGEPLLHPDFLAICRTLCDSGVALKIFSNGYAMDEKIVSELRALSVFLVGFTLFGHTDKSHEYISQVPGSFSRIVQAIKLVRAAGLPVDVTFFLMRHNFRYRQRMAAWARQELGVEASFSFSLTPRESGDRAPFRLEIGTDDMETFLREIGAKREAFQCGDSSIIPCTAGKTLVAVKADGRVTPCVSLDITAGDLNQHRFARIWKDSPVLQQFRRSELGDIEGCADCPNNSFCLRCFVNAHLLDGNVWGQDSHACRVTAAFLKAAFKEV